MIQVYDICVTLGFVLLVLCTIFLKYYRHLN